MNAAPRLLDLRPLQSDTGPEGACKLSKGRMVMRDPKDVDTLGLHQTGCVFGVKPYQVKAAGGDALLAQFLRAKNVHAHVTAFDEGTFAPSYPLLAYVNHGNGMNPYSIALEGEGFFNGMPGGKRGEPSDLLIDTMRAACLWIVENAAKEGAVIRYAEAHRQHSATRAGDPGHGIWKPVVMEYCVPKLGMQIRPMKTTRDGLPIPVKGWMS